MLDKIRLDEATRLTGGGQGEADAGHGYVHRKKTEEARPKIRPPPSWLQAGTRQATTTFLLHTTTFLLQPIASSSSYPPEPITCLTSSMSTFM